MNPLCWSWWWVIAAGVGLWLGGKFLYGRLLYCYKKRLALRDDPIFLKGEDSLLDQKIAYLLEKLREKRILTKGIYEVPESIQEELKKDKYSAVVLQSLADSIVVHTGAYNAVEVILRDQVTSNDISGQYEVYGKANWQVHLYTDACYRVAQIMAVLIHECVHNFLYYYNLELYPEAENEILTDVTAVFLGFGDLLREGYKPIKEIVEGPSPQGEAGFKVSCWKVGYLELNEIAYVQEKYNAFIREYTPEDIIYGRKLL